MRTQNGTRYYTVGEVADLVGVSAQTLRVWEQKGLLVPERSNGRQRLYTAEQLERANQVALLRRRHGWNPAAIKSSLASEPSRQAWAQLTLGGRLRVARRSRELTIREAARLVDVSRSLLSSIERGEANASSQLIARLANAYRMPTTAFVAGGDPDARIVRADQRPRTVLADGVAWEELAGPGHNLEPAVLLVPAGADSGGAYSRPGEVFVHVLAGVLAFSVDGDAETELGSGDSIILRPPSTWSWRNAGRRDARALYVEQLSPEDWT